MSELRDQWSSIQGLEDTLDKGAKVWNDGTRAHDQGVALAGAKECLLVVGNLREHKSELMETESEALKIADSIAESAKSAAGDLQKTDARSATTPDSDGPARAVLQRTSFHFVRSSWRPRFSWELLREELVANGTPVVQPRRKGIQAERVWTKRWKALRHFAADKVYKLLERGFRKNVDDHGASLPRGPKYARHAGGTRFS